MLLKSIYVGVSLWSHECAPPQVAFNALDMNRDGSLSTAELSEAFAKMGMPATTATAQVRTLMRVAPKTLHCSQCAVASCGLLCRRAHGLQLVTVTVHALSPFPSFAQHTLSHPRYVQTCLGVRAFGYSPFSSVPVLTSAV